MKFGDIVEQAWEITLKFKSLWLLGLFAEGAAFIFTSHRSHYFRLGDHTLIGPEGWVVLMLVGFVVGFILMILQILCAGALIDSVNRISRGMEYRLAEAFSAGFHVFWRFVGVWLLCMFAGIAVVAVLAIPVVLLYFIAIWLMVVALILAVPIFLVAVFIMVSLFSLTQRAIVARDCSIADALAEAYWLFRNNLGLNLGMFVLNMLLNIGTSLIILAIVGLAAAPFLALALSGTAGLVAAIVLGAPLAFALLLLAKGISGTFVNSVYTLFYLGLFQTQETVQPQAYPEQPIS